LEEIGLKDIAPVLEKEGVLKLSKPRPREEVLKEAANPSKWAKFRSLLST
jgi:hypothetical protein